MGIRYLSMYVAKIANYEICSHIFLPLFTSQEGMLKHFFKIFQHVVEVF